MNIEMEREAFEQAFVIQEGVYWSEDHQSYRSMNGPAIEDRDAIDATMWWRGWKARAALARPAQAEPVELTGAGLAFAQTGGRHGKADEPAPTQDERQPIGWYTDDHLTDKSATTYDREVADRWRSKGWPVNELYAAPIAQTAKGDE